MSDGARRSAVTRCSGPRDDGAQARARDDDDRDPLHARATGGLPRPPDTSKTLVAPSRIAALTKLIPQ